MNFGLAMKRLRNLFPVLLLAFLAFGTAEAPAHGPVSVAPANQQQMAQPEVLVSNYQAIQHGPGSIEHGHPGHGNCTGTCPPCCAAACSGLAALCEAPAMPMSLLGTRLEPPVLASQGDGLLLSPPAPPPRA